LSENLHFREYQIHKKLNISDKDRYEEFLRKREVLKKIPIFKTSNYPVLKYHDHPLFLQGPFIYAAEKGINAIWTCDNANDCPIKKAG
jgi:hypothetical protein